MAESPRPQRPRHPRRAGHLPHVGDAQLFNGHEVVGVEVFGHDATAGVEAVQLRQWSQHKAAPILPKLGRKGDSGDSASAVGGVKHKSPTPAGVRLVGVRAALFLKMRCRWVSKRIRVRLYRQHEG